MVLRFVYKSLELSAGDPEGKVSCCLLQVLNLSGGELQRVALTLCLGKPADVYLIDEPSAYLDSEQRLHAAKVIKRLATTT